jgi:hypothetical protein
VSEKELCEGDLTPAEALEFAQKQGAWHYEGGQIPSAPSRTWDEFAFDTDAHCDWRYVTGGMRVDGLCRQHDLDPGLIILSVRLIDTNVVTLTSPTQDLHVGCDFFLLLGAKDHVRQVLAHDREAGRYLLFIRDRVECMRKETVEVESRLFSKSPLLPDRLSQMLSVRRWTNSVTYWSDAHRAIEVLNRTRLYLGVFPPFIQAYKDFASAGRGFYNLPGPFLDDKRPNQYPTTAPIIASVDGDSVVVSAPLSFVNGYGRLPEPILSLVADTQSLVREASDMLQALVSSSELQAVMVTATVSLAAVLVSLAALVVAVVSICMRS